MKIMCVLVLFFAVFNLFSLESVFIGIGPELNANTRQGAALGGAIAAGLDLNRNFATGIKTGFFYDFKTVTALETEGFFRYYIPLTIRGLFIQAETGAVVFFEYGKPYPAFIGSLAAGWRINIGSMGFLEPSIRSGYPFAWGLGLLGGIMFDMKKSGGN